MPSLQVVDLYTKVIVGFSSTSKFWKAGSFILEILCIQSRLLSQFFGLEKICLLCRLNRREKQFLFRFCEFISWGAILPALQVVDLDAKVIVGFSSMNRFWKAGSFILEILCIAKHFGSRSRSQEFPMSYRGGTEGHACFSCHCLNRHLTW